MGPMPEDLRDKVQTLEIEIARLQEQKTASDRALELARVALEHSQAASNEWRQENIDQRGLFVTDDKVRGLLSAEAIERRALEGRVAVLEKVGSEGQGRHGAFDSLWTRAIGIAFVVIALAGLIAKFVFR
jgi:hypothetical protein